MTVALSIDPILASHTGPLEIAIINSAPERWFGKIGRRFGDLIAGLARNRPVRVHVARFGSLPEIVRDGQAIQSVDRLIAAGRIDAAIITGAEPTAADLSDEPYWQEFAEFHDWASARSVPLILSCLAAHAAVLHADGLQRIPLARKCFGVFEVDLITTDALSRGVPHRFAVPHSRWHGLGEEDLTQAGYRVLTRSDEVGVDIFTRRDRAVNLYLQGHPEYGPTTLLGEYRRDVERFERNQGPHPIAPIGDGGQAFGSGRHAAPWAGIARSIFGNWLDQVEAASFRDMTRVPAMMRHG